MGSHQNWYWSSPIDALKVCKISARSNNVFTSYSNFSCDHKEEKNTKLSSLYQLMQFSTNLVCSLLLYVGTSKQLWHPSDKASQNNECVKIVKIYTHVISHFLGRTTHYQTLKKSGILIVSKVYKNVCTVVSAVCNSHSRTTHRKQFKVLFEIMSHKYMSFINKTDVSLMSWIHTWTTVLKQHHDCWSRCDSASKEFGVCKELDKRHIRYIAMYTHGN